MRNASRLAIVLAGAAVLLHAGRAWAPFHLVVIDQVFLGTADCPNAQYVMLRLTAPGMVFVSNQTVRAQTADGTAAGDFGKFTMNLGNGSSGAKFIMGTADAAGLFGLSMDATANGQLSVQDGRVCFGSFGGQPVDCVAYGAFSGDNAPRGQPASAPPLGMALVRQSSTNNNANDFTVGAAAPQNNAGATGTLGQCPLGSEPTPTATVSADTPTGTIAAPTATATPGAPTATGTAGATPTGPPMSACVGDCNGDGRVLVNELVLGVNIALGSQPISACAAFDNGSGSVQVNVLVSAVLSALNGCPRTPGTTPTAGTPPSVTPTGAGGAATASATATTASGALGLRHFSVNPETSRLIAVLSPDAMFPTAGLQGFLDLSAGAPDPVTGVATIDVTDASEFLSVDVPSASVAICIRVLRDQLPVRRAGVIACNGGTPLGVRVTQNHALGVVGTCATGPTPGQVCTADGDCSGGTCFTAGSCTAAGGTVENSEAPHPNVCNGPFEGELDAPPSPPGTVLISPDPTNGLITGLPVQLLRERALPCGDEPDITGPMLSLSLSSDHAISRILNANNHPGETLEAQIAGEPFSCATWTQEDGPGTLVLSAPNLDSPIAPGAFADVLTHLIFDD